MTATIRCAGLVAVAGALLGASWALAPAQPSPAERSLLTRRAVNALAQRAAAGGDLAVTLQEVRQTRAQTRYSSGTAADALVPRILEALEARLGERLVLAQVNALGDRLDREDWAQAVAAARELTALPTIPAPVSGTLQEAARLGRQLTLLQDLQKALAAAVPEMSGAWVAALKAPDVGSLPPAIRDAVKGVRGLALLRSVANSPGGARPDVPALRAALTELQAGTGLPGLCLGVQQELAVKCFLDGHAAEARALLPGNGPVEHAAALLDDLHALATGTGERRTWPAERLTVPPPGIRNLAPAPANASLPRRRAEKDYDDLRAVETVLALEPSLRERLTAGLQPERDRLRADAGRVVTALRQWSRKELQQDQEDKALADEISKRLRRPLSAAEQALVGQLRRQGRRATETVALLQKAGPFVPAP